MFNVEKCKNLGAKGNFAELFFFSMTHYLASLAVREIKTLGFVSRKG